MDLIPIDSTRPEDSTARDDDVYTEIQMDPASIPAAPAPVVPFPHSEEEEEEEEMEPEEAPASGDDGVQPMSDDDQPSDQAPPEDDHADRVSGDPAADDMPVDAAPTAAVPARSPTPPFFVHHLPRFGGPRTIRTPRKRVRLPRTPYASTSRARPHTLASPPQSTPSLDYAIAHLDFIPSATPSTPASSPARAASSVAPTQDAPASPVVSPYHVDPAINYIMEHLHDAEIDVFRMKENLTKIPGPDNFEDHERHLKHLDRQLEDLGNVVNSILERLSMADHRIYETHRQVFARGGLSDQYRNLQRMRGDDRVENQRLRRRISDLEDRLDAMHLG